MSLWFKTKFNTTPTITAKANPLIAILPKVIVNPLNPTINITAITINFLIDLYDLLSFIFLRN